MAWTIFRSTKTVKWQVMHQRFASQARLVLGIESTFDDTGAAVVDENGNILGEALHVQSSCHVENRGVDPRIAQSIHREQLPLIVNDALERANVTFSDLGALATATKPGLSLSLGEGLRFSQFLVQQHKLLFIPVHHMEAHLLTSRLCYDVDFPFLNLLVSGGHCILCIAHQLGNYEILGEAIDEPPGAVFDKVARALQMLECYDKNRLSTGKDLEELAKSGNCYRYEPVTPFARRHKRACNFSFSGMQTQVLRRIESSNQDDYADIAAWFQYSAFRHILKQVHRGILFCKEKGYLPLNYPKLVVSGGVACNQALRGALNNLCEDTGMELLLPPARLCTDNGVMIAWAGMEYLRKDCGVSEDPLNERYSPRAPLGRHIDDEVADMHIKLPKLDYFKNYTNSPVPKYPVARDRHS